MRNTLGQPAFLSQLFVGGSFIMLVWTILVSTWATKNPASQVISFLLYFAQYSKSRCVISPFEIDPLFILFLMPPATVNPTYDGHLSGLQKSFNRQPEAVDESRVTVAWHTREVTNGLLPVFRCGAAPRRHDGVGTASGLLIRDT